MERLTERWGEGDVWVKNHDYVSAAYRLAAYEDTGMTPEEVNDAVVGAKLMAKSQLVSVLGVAAERLLELAEADKAGRLVVLPCKVGDTVYTLTRTFDGADVVGEAELWWTDIPQLGKTVFLTREEAKKALEAKSNDDRPSN